MCPSGFLCWHALTGYAAAEERPEVLRLRKVQIHRFRDVAPGTVLEFADGVNALIGLNGTGKTTLLNLLSALLRFDVSEFREEFDISVEMVDEGEQSGDRTIEFRVSSEFVPASELPDDADTSDGASAPGGEFRLALEVKYSYDAALEPITFSVRDDGLVEMDGSLIPGRFDISRPDFVSRLGNLRPVKGAFTARSRRQGAIEVLAGLSDLRAELATTGRLDEGLDAFRALTAGEAYSAFGIRPLKLALTYDKADASLIGWTFEHRDYLKRWAAPSDRDSAALDHPDSNAMGLTGLPEAIGAQSVELELQRVEERDSGGSRTYTFRGCHIRARWDESSASHHSEWSFGQKRIAALFLAAACVPEGVILADELSNGMHHKMMETCIELIGERQAILATQNPLLLDHLWFDSAEAVRRSLVLCEVRRREGGGREWVWRNPTVEEAESVYAAFKVDVLHVSEILRSKGLW